MDDRYSQQPDFRGVEMITTAKTSLAAIFLVALLLQDSSASALDLAASKKSNKYHYTDCRWAKKIKLKNRIMFRNVSQARKLGYRPCKACKPPGRMLWPNSLPAR
ncbi:Ada metal-binding domain-containing protein [Thermodesulfobacteriota bacterium]